MKKLLSVAVAAITIAAVADEYFSPTIGVQEFTSNRDNFIIPVQFKTISTDVEITANNLVCTNGLENGTVLYIYQGGAYKSWVLGATGWAATARSSDQDGIQSAADTAGQTLPLGSAIWIHGANGKTFYTYGNYHESFSTTIVANRANLVANPTASTVTGEQLVTKIATILPQKGDKITPLGGDSFSGYYSYNGTDWKHVVGSNATIENPQLPDIASHQGFWYLSKGESGGAGTFNW